MEMTRQKIEVHGTVDAQGRITETGERAVGKVERSEFGAPDDNITAAIGGSYTMQWSPDFFQSELEREDAVCARFYIDKRVAVDVADPQSKLSKRKRHLLFKNGFGYVCIPPGFSQDMEPIRNLYRAAVNEYKAYEALHPRKLLLQDTTFVDTDGTVKSAKVPAIDIKVGGGMVGSFADQQKAFANAKELSKSEAKLAKQRVRTMKAIRRARQDGKPFRNPFIGEGKRKYLVDYESAQEA